MSRILINNLTFAYTGSYDNIFENVSLQLDTTWRLGLVGRNGKGKTTLLKILTGELRCEGSIMCSESFEYFPFDIVDKSQLLCQILDVIDPRYEEWKIRKEAALLGFNDLDIYKPFEQFSCGEQTKILLAALFSKENAFLLIDEPTNHLDRNGRRVLAEYLHKKSSYIIVSHDKSFMDGCIDHVLSINKSNIEVNACNLSEYLANKALRDLSEANENYRLKVEVKRLKDASHRVGEWADKAEAKKFCGSDTKSGLRPDRGFLGAKAAKISRRAASLKDRMSDSIQEKSELLKNIDTADSLKLTAGEFHTAKLAVIDNLRVMYGNYCANNPVTFDINQGDRICFIGGNGSGKSSVLKAIMGLVEYSGSIEYNSRLVIDYIPQDTSYLNGSLKEFCEIYNVDLSMMTAMLFKLGCEKEVFEKDLGQFSQGAKKKVLIAKSLLIKANLFIWDEPLNYLDIITRQQITDMLLSTNATMIFVEHDADFCDGIATRTIIFE